MKRITKIELTNYKAFYGKGTIEIPFDHNLLIYGENGSGKSSVYEALKQFITSASEPAMRLSENIISQEEKPYGAEVLLTFTNEDEKSDLIAFYAFLGTPVQGVEYLEKANTLNSFLSYRELLRTYLMEKPHDKEEFRKKFGKLLIETILAKTINSSTQQSYKTDWESLHQPRKQKKEELLVEFITGLDTDLQKLNVVLTDILAYFDPSLKVGIINHASKIAYAHSDIKQKILLHPIIEIGLAIQLQGVNLDNDHETHLTILNEARLSALAISIYLSSLVISPQKDFQFKMLFLDDVFIGLDMSNRLSLLEILTKYRTPVLETVLDADGNLIVKLNRYEDTCFFHSYQIFMTTYDKSWFAMAKQYFDSHQDKKWHYIEMYVDRISHKFDVPAIIPCKEKIETAEQYFHMHDYRACAIYLRTACEEALGRILPKSMQQYVPEDKSRLETRKLILNDLLKNFENFCTIESIDFKPFQNLKLYKDHILNSLSHNDIETPIYKKELIETMHAVRQLDRIKLKSLTLNAKRREFQLTLTDKEGVDVVVWIKSVDTIHFIEIDQTTRLSKAGSCVLESIKRGEVKEELNQSFESLWKLYTYVCVQYGIEEVHAIANLICERRSGKTGKSLTEMIAENQ